MANLSAIRDKEATTNANAARVDMKLEVVIIPVSDADRAKEFYSRLGWRLDADFTAGNDWRGVQDRIELRRLHGRHGPAAAASGAQGRGTGEPDGGRLDGR